MKAAKITLKEHAPSTLRVLTRRFSIFFLETPVENKIRRLSQEGNIDTTDNSPYLSPIVVVSNCLVSKSNNQIRLCVDYRQINKYIQIDQHYMLSFGQIFSELHGAGG